jgi:hypothetical protein
LVRLSVGHTLGEQRCRSSIGGKMMKMMQLRGPLAQVQTALAAIETEY